jgi:hypothetical protein
MAHSIGVIVMALALVANANSAHAQNKCLGAKLKAIGKKESAKVVCYAKAAARNDYSGLSQCLAKAEAKFVVAFAKADAAGGPCLGDTDTCECIVDGCIKGIRGQLPDAGPSACESARLKAAARKAKRIFACNAKATTKGVAVDATCVQKAKDKFAAAFAKTTGCTGDQTAVEDLVDGRCIGRAGADSAGGAMVTVICEQGTHAPPCSDEGQPCGSCGDGVCVRTCDCVGAGALVCLSNGTALLGSCTTDAECPAGDTCAVNTAAGGACGSGLLNACAASCP